MSKIVNESRLNHYTVKLWERIKTQLTNETFKNAELLADGVTLQFTTKDNQTVDVDLSNFAKLNDYVHKVNDTTNVGGVIGANKVVMLGPNGVLDENMLPEAALNGYYPEPNLATAENQRNDYQNGDVIFDEDTRKTYLVINNDPAVPFQDAIIELSQGGINLPIDATDVNYNKANTQMQADNAQQAIDELHGLLINRGNINNTELQLEKNNGQFVNVDLAPVLVDDKIVFNAGTTGMLATNVQEAIHELKRDMGLLDDSNVYIVPDEAELNNLLAQTALKTGDIIYIINSDGVVDFNDINVNNGTNPVAMIYDDALNTGNKLRIFSKLDAPINIDAHNVAYDDQTTNLGAANVQEAVENLNDKFGEYVHKVNDTTNVGGAGQQDKVVRLDGNGLLAESMLPEIAINKYYPFANLAAAEAQRNTFQNGDVIYDQNTQKTYLVINNTPNNNFQQDAIIDLNAATGVTNVRYDQNTKEIVVTIGGQEARHSLENLVDVTDVTYDKNTNIIRVTKPAGPEEIDLSELNTKINGHDPVAGNVELGLKQAGDDIVLTVQGLDTATVTIDGFVKTVNQQQPQAGDVTVKAEHVPYDKQNTNLQSDNVQAAIDEIHDKFKSGYVTSTFDPQTGRLTLNKHDGAPDTHDLGMHVDSARLDDATRTLHLIKTDNTEVNIPLVSVLTAGKIDFVQGNTGMAATDVQAAIEELNDRTKTLQETYIVADNNALQALLQSNVVKNEDIIYITDSTGVVDFAQTNVDNGNRPVAMIYDGTAGGNNLRVLSKVDSHIGKYYLRTEFVDAGGVGNAGSPIKLDNNGLIAADMLPQVATSEYYEVQDMPTAEAQKANCQNGDVIKITGTNKTYLCVDATKPNFNDAFVEISPQTINVGVTDVEYREANQELIVTKQGGAQTYSLSELNTKVNGIAPIAGNVTINASEIYLKDKPAQSIEDELKTKLVSINSQTGIDGNVNLSLRIVADNLEFKAENTPIDTLELYTDAEANTLIQYFN